MKNYTISDWASFLRSAIDPDTRREMQALLDRGDADAVRAHGLAESVRSSLAEFEAIEVPDTVFRRAKALFQPLEKEAIFSLPRIVAELLFDSALTPQPAGLRGLSATHRETVHAAAGIQVSLRVEQEPGTYFMAVVGQLQQDAREGSPADPVANRPVLVFQREQLVARTLSGRNGEFQMEFRGKYPLKLVVLLEDPARRIDLDLVLGGPKGVKRPPSEADL